MLFTLTRFASTLRPVSPPGPVLQVQAIFRRLSMLASLDWTQVVNDQSPAYSVFTKPIQKSSQDDRDYRLIRLENGLHAMLIHDAKTDKAAASLDVAVGHLYDPVSTIETLQLCERYVVIPFCE